MLHIFTCCIRNIVLSYKVTTFDGKLKYVSEIKGRKNNNLNEQKGGRIMNAGGKEKVGEVNHGDNEETKTRRNVTQRDGM